MGEGYLMDEPWDVGDTVYFCRGAAKQEPGARVIQEGQVVSRLKDRSVTCVLCGVGAGFLLILRESRGDWVSANERYLKLRCEQTAREKAWNET